MNLLIDGSSLLWRTHYASNAQNLTGVSSDIYLFLKCLKSYANMYNTRNIYIAWDKKLNTEENFRILKTNGEYKNHRNEKNAKEVYESQEDIHKVTEMLSCKNLYPWIMEADDIIAWLSKTLEGQNIIITTDCDMLQLINNRTCVYHPRKKIIIDHKNFTTTQGMPIEHYIAYKAILGDTSDNIKGINGYGPVGAKKLAKTWIEKTEPIKPEYVNIIETNTQLMDLSIGYTFAGTKEVDIYQEQLNNLKDITPDFVTFEDFCNKHHFDSIIKDINKWKKTFESSRLLDILNNITV